ncbi:restriction endonuclease subunit S [Aminicella lysinilytica]|uniref:Restriction endonuclease S subunit n=1 Tax=Aminicella lysinilytica TaxID=433323 RepID=A0A4R6Q4F7_9FIRM|nr:restriction endonuclease subunit S [Aminicella lysinilytica]TDP56363.1 restriction endonuclease S subunit [Aminicella lysinilytica]
MINSRDRVFCPLSDYIIEYTDRNVANEYKPVAVGRYGIRTRESIYSKELAKNYEKNKLIYKDTLTVGMGSKQVDIGILSDDVTYSVSPAYHTYRITGINCDYLRYCLRCRNSDMFARYVKRGSRQGKSIDLKRWIQYVIPVYSDMMQHEIVKRLDKAESLIALRNSELKELDELIKARFVEMFGNPVTNEKGWPTKTLEKLCNSIVDCPHSTPNYTFENTGYMCIRTSIVKENCIRWNEIEYISEEEFRRRIQRKRPEKGDIVYTREGAILGIAAIIDKDCNVALGQRSMLLSPNEHQCSSVFLSVAMNFKSFLRTALRSMSGSASPHINVGDIKSFVIIVPPIEMQNEFEAFVNQVDKSKVA